MDALAQLRASLAQARGAGPTGPPGLDDALRAVLETGEPDTLQQAYAALCDGVNISPSSVAGTEGQRRAAAERFAEAYAHSGPAIGRVVQAVKRAKAAGRYELFPGGKPTPQESMRLDPGLLRPCELGAGRGCAVCGSGARGGQDLQAQLADFFRDARQGWNKQFQGRNGVQQDRLAHLRALVAPLMCRCPGRPTACECGQLLIVTEHGNVNKKLVVNKSMKRYGQRVEQYNRMGNQLALLHSIEFTVGAQRGLARDVQLNALNAAEAAAMAAAIQVATSQVAASQAAQAAPPAPAALPAAQLASGAPAAREAGAGTSAAPSVPVAARPPAAAFAWHRRSRAMDMDHEDIATALQQQQQQQQQPVRSSPSGTKRPSASATLEQSGSATKRLCQEQQQQQQHEVPGPAAAAASPAPSASAVGSARGERPAAPPACSPAHAASRPGATPARSRGAAGHHVSLATPHASQARSGASALPGTTAGSVSAAGGRRAQRGGDGGKSRMQVKIQTVLKKMARQEAGEQVSMKKQERVLSDYIKTAQKTMAKWLATANPSLSQGPQQLEGGCTDASPGGGSEARRLSFGPGAT